MPGWLSSLRDLIVEASPVRRFMLSLFVLLPLAALAVAYLWVNPPAYRVLYTQLSDRSGGEVIAALEQLDIAYRLSPTDGTIEVPADQLHAARYRLAARGLPKSDSDVQNEVERSPSFGASSLQEQQRFQHELELDLARSIQKLDAVELARVHLALPKVSPFLRDAPPATAAVLVRLRAGAQLDSGQVTTIQTLVAASVPRLKRTEVQVLDPSGVLLGGAVPEAAQSHRLALEKDLEKRALAVLTPWLGEDRVNVQVTATLEDSETRQTIERVRPLEKTISTTRVPEGRIQRLSVIVILGFEASVQDRRRAAHMARQALDLQSTRGDTLSVYVLPEVVAKPEAELEMESPVAKPETPASVPAPIPQGRPVSTSPGKAPFVVPPLWLLVLGIAIVVSALVMMGWRRRRQVPVGEVQEAGFETELETARNQALADPRVTADVIKLWMRA